MLRMTFLEIFFSLFRGEIRIDSKEGLSGQANPCDFEGRHALNCTFIRPYRIFRRSTQLAQKGEIPSGANRVHREPKIFSSTPRNVVCCGRARQVCRRPYKRPPAYVLNPLLYNPAWLDPKGGKRALETPSIWPTSETDLILKDNDL